MLQVDDLSHCITNHILGLSTLLQKYLSYFIGRKEGLLSQQALTFLRIEIRYKVSNTPKFIH